MTHEAGMALTHICHALEYLQDRDGADNLGLAVVTGVRYNPPRDQPLDYIEVISGGRVIHIKAEDVSPHTHTFNKDGDCMCGEWREQIGASWGGLKSRCKQ